MDARLFARPDVVAKPREHVAAVVPQILLGVGERVPQLRAICIGRGNRMVEYQRGFDEFVAFARGFFAAASTGRMTSA